VSARRISPQRARLGARLRDLRASRFRSGSALARHLGWQQTRVSKLELGSQLPSPEDLDIWIEATGAGPEARAELGELLTRARIEYRVWDDAYRSGAIATRQAEIAALESKVSTIREYQPAMVPGILQTPAYAREMLSIPGGAVLTGATPSSIESLIAERVKRQEVLYQPGRHIQVVLGEPALWTYFDTTDTLRGQLDRLVTLSGLVSVELGVLRIAQPSPAMPLSGFSIHDEDVVFVETLTGEQRLEDPSEVLAYLKMFDLLREAAATGPEAIALIQNALAQLDN
jgi:transcriptional regulator with XRE-family HTH domain